MHYFKRLIGGVGGGGSKPQELIFTTMIVMQKHMFWHAEFCYIFDASRPFRTSSLHVCFYIWLYKSYFLLQCFTFSFTFNISFMYMNSSYANSFLCSQFPPGDANTKASRNIAVSLMRFKTCKEMTPTTGLTLNMYTDICYEPQFIMLV